MSWRDSWRALDSILQLVWKDQIETATHALADPAILLAQYRISRSLLLLRKRQHRDNGPGGVQDEAVEFSDRGCVNHSVAMVAHQAIRARVFEHLTAEPIQSRWALGLSGPGRREELVALHDMSSRVAAKLCQLDTVVLACAKTRAPFLWNAVGDMRLREYYLRRVCDSYSVPIELLRHLLALLGHNVVA